MDKGISKVIKQIRRSIVTGVIVLIPSVITLYVFVKLFTFVDSMLPKFFHSILPFIPLKWGVPGIGVVLVLVIAYFVGVAAKNYFGRMVIDTGNALIARIPLLNKIYLGVQQVMDSMSGNNKSLFERVVLVEFPKTNVFSIGFVTSESTGEIADHINPDTISVYIPTTPIPSGGYLIYVPRASVKELHMSVETAVKLVMSGGIINSEQIKKTNHMYTLPKHLKNFNWLGIFKRRDSRHNVDPRD